MKYTKTGSDGFFVCWGIGDVCHYGPVSTGEQVHTGQPNFEFFDSEESLKAKVESLGKEYENYWEEDSDL